ncbi:recombinase family protein [Oscillospiraceae bacterium 44-5]|jgi:site-specific DNA recombinase|nr:recombinase family protein [Lawsonibacter sp.]
MAQRNRYDEYLKRKQGIVEPSVQWKAAEYLRISREDGDKEESDSIGSQKDITHEYVEQNDDIVFIDEYVDDGWTGTNFTRPDFERMMADIKCGAVNCIIVKDLSRLGRNYILVGQYLEMIFPLLNIRFISVVDHIDSVKDPASINNALVSFKNVMNDEYCRDISNKVRASLDRKRGKGEFIGSFASYGYFKDPEDHHRLVIDPIAAEVVRNIYQWFMGGMSIIGIAKKLNQLGVPNPTMYKKQLGFNYRHPTGELCDGLWPDSSVKRILKNRIYTGDMVQSKTKIKSYKVQVCTNVPEEKWIVVPDTHEAIISRDQFETVQQLLRRDTRTAPGVTHVSIFGGYIRCADCRRAMGKKTTSQPYKKYYYYVCQTFRKGDQAACTKHTIREEKLYQAVLTTIQAQIQLAVSMDDVLQELKKKDIKARKSSRLDSMLEMKKQEHAKISQFKIDLYPDWKSGIISKSEYLSLKEKFDKQLEQIERAIANIKEEIKQYKETTSVENQFIKHFLKYRNITELSREVIVELIEMIYVHEGGTITIDFKYQDEYQRLLDLMEEHAASAKAG